MKHQQLFPNYINIIIYLFSASLFAYFLDYSMLDDGLRHIAFATHPQQMRTWGEIFPHSLFFDYDPWYVWHKFIATLHSIVPFEYLHSVINTITLFLLMILIEKYLIKYVHYNMSSLIFILVFSLLLMTSIRYLYVRPDQLSGLFVMSALLLNRNKFLPIFILTLLYAPTYYLFFMYTGSIGLVHLVQQNKKAFLGVFLGSLFGGFFFLIQDASAYFQTITYILTDQSLRQGLEVGEGKPLFSILSLLPYSIIMPLFFIIISFIIYKYYNYFKENSLALFLLITSLLWLNQVRYYSLFMPLIFIYIFSLVSMLRLNTVLYILRKYFVLGYKAFHDAKNNILFYGIAIPYAIFMIALKFQDGSTNEILSQSSYFSNEKFNNKTILLSKLDLDLYIGLYNNPTIKFVPSCSIGWFDDSNRTMKDIYIRMQEDDGVSEEELSSLLDFVKADYYMHHTTHPNQILDMKKLSDLGITPKYIINDRILFYHDKNL
jgi:hypothetical protein